MDERERKGHWVMFDTLYHFIVQLSPTEILEAGDEGRNSLGELMQKEKEQILSQICPLRREWTWTARRGWFEAAVAYRLKSRGAWFQEVRDGCN